VNDDTEDLTWLLSPHGRSKDMAQWVVDQHGHKEEPHIRRWVEASKQILNNGDTK
jgi:hypothetical protein